LSHAERAFLDAVGRVARANPFLPERVAAERDALGADYRFAGAVWYPGQELVVHRENLRLLHDRLGVLLERLRAALAAGAWATAAEREAYEIACFYYLYDSFDERLETLIERPAARVPFYDAFAAEVTRLFALPGSPPPPEPGHLFAVFFQIRRVFHYLIGDLLGTTLALAKLRASVWASILSCDVFRYHRSLYQEGDDLPTLVTGPTGTGKDVVARVIGRCRYVAFDVEGRRFVADHHRTYHAVNLSELAPSVLESELFGHVRGAFTGALCDSQPGWLEQIKVGGTLFLDEIGDLPLSVQVKLLRVIQNREFSRVGSREVLPFHGKLVTATHRDLGAMMRREEFRADLYYRISVDRITTPSLRAQLDEAPGELGRLVRSIVSRRKLARSDVDATTERVEAWILRHAPADYAWSGNMRELADCVGSVVWQDTFAFEAELASSSAPLSRRSLARIPEEWRGVLGGELSLDQVMNQVVTIELARTGNQAETARRLAIDPRMVSRRTDHALLARLRKRDDT
jgi:transcriptional regulator with AAA-type ATPase domain